MNASAMENLQYAMLAVLPFVYYVNHISPYEVPKTWVMWSVAVIGLGVGVFRNKIDKPSDNKLVGIVGVLIVWLVFCSLWSGEFWQSWWGNPYRSDGLLTLLAMVVVGMTISVRPRLLQLLGLSSLILASWVVMLGNPSDPLTIGNVNMLAGYLSFVMLGSWGGVLTGLCWVVLEAFRTNKKLMLATLMIIVIAILSMYGRDFRENVSHGDFVAEGRGRILTKAMMAIGVRPVTGWGWARFSRAFAEIDYPIRYEIDANVDRTHASILEFGVAGGVVAIALYLMIIGMTVTKLSKSKSRVDQVLMMLAILYLIQSQTNVTSVVQDWLFWLGVGRAIEL